jgi:hypothetical protein
MININLHKIVKTIETAKVSRENGVYSLLAPFLGVLGSIETFENATPRLSGIGKATLYLFKFYPLKTQSLSILIKR